MTIMTIMCMNVFGGQLALSGIHVSQSISRLAVNFKT